MGFGHIRETERFVIIDMQNHAPLIAGGHVHSCPECYENVPCEMTCSCEEDLTLDDGTPRGAYDVCDPCLQRTAQAPPKSGATDK